MSQMWQALPVDLSRDGFHDEFLDKENPRRDRRPRKLLGEGRRHSRGPLHRRWSNHRNSDLADRGRHDKCNEGLVLVIQNSGLDLAELGLQDILNGLSLNAMSAHFELRIDPAEELHA